MNRFSIFFIFSQLLFDLFCFEFLLRIIEEPISEFLHMNEYFPKGDDREQKEIDQQERPENREIEYSGQSA